MLLARAFSNVSLVNVVSPDGIECCNITCHAGHEGSNECGDAHTENATRVELLQEQGKRHVVIGIAVCILRKIEASELRLQCENDDAGKDDDCGHQYFRNGSDDGSSPCIVQVLRDHCTLYHQEVGAPIAKREHE